MASSDDEVRDDEQPPAVLQVDATLEDLLDRIEDAVQFYLESPGVVQSDRLRDVLTSLDEYVARSDAHENSFFQSAALGFTTRGSVIGETGPRPFVDEVAASEFRAQTSLVVAAKQEVTETSPTTIDALRAALESLRASRPKGSSGV